MSLRIPRSSAVALAIALTLTSIDLTPASAASISGRTQASQSSTIDFSARRRWHRGNAAAFGAILGVFGTIAAVAAANQYRDRYYYYDGSYDGSYGYVPYGTYGGPYVYGSPFVYAHPYRFRRWHHHHH
jgi:hypothetical protein